MVLDWLDLEVKANKRKYHALQILNQVIEAPQAICILALVDVNERTYLGSCE